MFVQTLRKDVWFRIFSVLQRIIQCIAEEREMLIEMKMDVAYIPEGEVW